MFLRVLIPAQPVLVRNLRTMRVVYWVNVSESSAVGSPSLSCIKVPAEGNVDLQTLICVFVARPRRCLTLSNPVP